MYPAGLTCRVGGRPDEGKDPTCPLWRGITTHKIIGLDKCAVAHFVNGRLSGHNFGVTIGKTDTINCLEPGQVYKYLGVDESNGIKHSMMRKGLRHK